MSENVRWMDKDVCTKMGKDIKYSRTGKGVPGRTLGRDHLHIIHEVRGSKICCWPKRMRAREMCEMF